MNATTAQTIPVLGQGEVALIDHMGSDLRIVEAARVSRKSPSKGPEQDAKLMEYLFTHGHWTPFEQCQITFHIKAPIFVLRQLMRHRALHWNETSARYREMDDTLFYPEQLRKQAQKNKQGSEGELDAASEGHAMLTYAGIMSDAITAYRRLLELGVCREQARAVLPVALFSEVYCTGDLRNLMNLFYLRTAPDAQAETREVAQAMVDLTAPLFPVAMGLWRKYEPRIVEREAVR